MENSYLYYAIGAAVLSLLYGSVLIFKILKQPAGSGKMLEIAKAIQEGAMAYLKRQYKTVALVAIAVLILLYVGDFSKATMVAFLVGSVLSAVAGFVGMNISVRANVRTAEAAKKG